MAENNTNVIEKTEEKKLTLLASSPHVVKSVNAQALMRNVIIALLPVTVFGILMFGVHALLVVLVSVVSALVAEALFRKLTKRDVRIKDLSAVVTGLLLALVLPPATPPWMVVLGAVFAVVVAKEFFGGLGANVFNPALTGRAFLLMSFPAALTTWHRPLAGALTDATTTATPLAVLKQGVDLVSGASLHFGANLSGVESNVGSQSYGALIQSLFLGSYAGTIGETSALLILVGAVFLVATNTIDLRAPLAFICMTLVCSLVAGFDPLVALLSGGVLFGAVFMATDYVSTPVTGAGRIIFGLGAGLITVLIRKLGNYPEGVMFSILIMNIVTPFLNRIMHKKYGWQPAPKATPKAATGGK
jgi:electron transport complex protein RnfD